MEIAATAASKIEKKIFFMIVSLIELVFILTFFEAKVWWLILAESVIEFLKSLMYLIIKQL